MALPNHERERVVISHPSSPAYLRQDVMSLFENGMLEYFATTFLDHPNYPLARTFRTAANAFRPSWIKQLERRSFHEVPIERVRTRAPLELLRTLFSAVLDWSVTTDFIWELQELDFDAWVGRNLPRHIDAVYCYEHAALATLKRARARGVYSFLNQPAQHFAFYEQVHKEQLRRYPEIANSVTAINTGTKERRRNARKSAELRLADCIICNSSFTRRTLIGAGVQSRRIEVVPYGFPQPGNARKKPEKGPVIFMNAGSQNLRKGLHLLYRAWHRLNFTPDQAELWLVGKMLLPESLRQGLPGRVKIVDSVPHQELLRMYSLASVFVLPSLADGFGMVITEAMSRGLPVIATDNTGAADVIEAGQTGFVIPAGDEDALVRQMQWCVDHSGQLEGMSERALEAAAEWQWSDYRKAVATLIRRRLAERDSPAVVAAQ